MNPNIVSQPARRSSRRYTEGIKLEARMLPITYYPNQKTALCTPEQLDILLKWDHHTVEEDGVRGVLVTYHLMESDPLTSKSGRVIIVFHHAEKHQAAPDEVQNLVNQLQFQDLSPG